MKKSLITILVFTAMNFVLSMTSSVFGGILDKVLVMSAWFTGLQLNTGIAQETENKSSFILSLNSSGIFLGNAIGSSLAAVVITLSGIQNIVFISLITSLLIILIQFISNKKFSA